MASIAQVLGDIEELHGQPIDWKLLYEKALNHDYTERFIGDIKTPVKYASKELRGMLQTVEEKMTDEFINQEIPEALQDVYRRRLFEGKDDTVEGELLAVSDKIDLLYESFDEISKNNRRKSIKRCLLRQSQRSKASTIDLPSNIFQGDFSGLLNQEFYGKEDFLAAVSNIVKKRKRIVEVPCR